MLSLNECLDKIKLYLRHIIIDLQNSNTSKIQLTITINFISWKHADEEHVMHMKWYDNQIILLMNFSRHFFQDINTI